MHLRLRSPRLPLGALLLGAVFKVAACVPASAEARTPVLEPEGFADEPESESPAEQAFPPARDPETAPALYYARLERTACERELSLRGVPFVRVDSARGVDAPERLRGPVRGVVFHSGLGGSKREVSPFEIADCRLLLALDDLAQILSAHGVVEVVHYSMYRPPGSKWKAGERATRHPGGLAIDAATFVRKDGTRLNVEKDFHGRIGGTLCGPSSFVSPATKDALELRKIACEIRDAHIFNVQLTPMNDRPHANHMHLEVTPNVSWFFVR